LVACFFFPFFHGSFRQEQAGLTFFSLETQEQGWVVGVLSFVCKKELGLGVFSSLGFCVVAGEPTIQKLFTISFFLKRN